MIAQGSKNVSNDNKLTFSLTCSGDAAISMFALAVYILKEKHWPIWNGDVWSV
jgi:hypothetical protein